jgi:hypothetical protein
VATAILRGPYADVKEYVQNCSDPFFRVVEAYSDAIVHLVIESAQLLRAGRELPAILHKDVCTAFKEYGIHLKLHQRHRVEGDEVMSREEVASICRERAIGGVDPVQGRLSHDYGASMALLTPWREYAPLTGLAPPKDGSLEAMGMPPTPRDAHLTPIGCMVMKAGDTKGLEAGQRRWSGLVSAVVQYVGDFDVRWRLIALPHLISCDHHDERQGRNRPGGAVP